MNDPKLAIDWKRGFLIKKFAFILRVQLAWELWYKTLANGNRHYTVFGIEMERDEQDPSIEVWTLVILGLTISAVIP